MWINSVISRSTFLIDSKLRAISNITLRGLLLLKGVSLEISPKPIIIFSPHQDDETLGCGGLIALKREQKVSVRVVFLTDGRYGRPDWIEPEEITTVRQQEAFKALEILGVLPAEICFLNYPDASLKQLSKDQREDLITKITGLIQTPNVSEVYVPYHQDNHPDHEATYDLVRTAITRAKLSVELWQYPIWAFWQAPSKMLSIFSNIQASHLLSITTVRSRKKQAMSTYASQATLLQGSLGKSFLLPCEIFVKAKP